MEKVSVIVPVYNVQDYVQYCIDSILNQTLTDLEIICVDDGSKDNSGEILDRYARKDKRVQVIHKDNTGYGHTMNMGIAQATGEYIGIVESDDFIDSNMYYELYGIADKYSLDYVKSNYWAYEDGKRVLSCGLCGCECNKVISRYDNMQKILSTKSVWAGIYRRKFLIDNQISFLETPGASYQDISFWFKVCIAAERGYFSEKAYVNYRTDNNSSSVKSHDKVFAVCDEMEECKRYMEKSCFNMETIYPYYIINKKNAYIWNLERILPEYRQAFIKRASKELQSDRLSPYIRGLNLSEWKKIGLEEWDVDELNYLSDSPQRYLNCINNEYVTAILKSKEELLNLIQSEEYIYIYGAGKVGQGLSRYISDSKVACSVRYVVTRKNNNDLEDILEINSPQLDTNRKVFIAVANGAAKKQMGIRAMCRGFEFVYGLDSAMMQFLKEY